MDGTTRDAVTPAAPAAAPPADFPLLSYKSTSPYPPEVMRVAEAVYREPWLRPHLDWCTACVGAPDLITKIEILETYHGIFSDFIRHDPRLTSVKVPPPRTPIGRALLQQSLEMASTVFRKASKELSSLSAEVAKGEADMDLLTRAAAAMDRRESLVTLFASAGAEFGFLAGEKSEAAEHYISIWLAER